MNKKVTMDDISASLLTPVQSTASEDSAVMEKVLSESPTVGEEAELDDQNTTDEEALEEDDLEASDEEEDVDEADESDEEEADEGDEETDQFLDVKDEDLIQVKIDGKWETRTIAEAKKALSGEGAIEKRLKEVTDTRNEATRTLQRSQEEAAEQVTILTNVVTHMGEALFKPMVSKPDENLINSNPQEYQRRDLQYRKELERVTGLKQQFGQVFQALNQKMQEDRQSIRAAEKKKLAEQLPVLSDPKLGPTRQKAIIEAAEHYGFDKSEISMVSDHRLFLMAHDAAMYRLSQSKTGVEELKKKVAAKPRTLRSGSTTAKTRAKQSQKQREAVTKQAAASGKVDDIALAILKPAGRRR